MEHDRYAGLGALLLAGGASSRMGQDKALLDWNGARAVDLVAARAREVGADPVVTVGTRDFGLPNVQEDKPGGGPVGGIVSGCRALRESGCRRALVLAVDAPTLRSDDLRPLVEAASPGAAYAGLHLPLVIDLRELPVGAGGGWSMARLLTEAGVSLLPPDPAAARRLRGANTPDERAELLRDFAAQPPG